MNYRNLIRDLKNIVNSGITDRKDNQNLTDVNHRKLKSDLFLNQELLDQDLAFLSQSFGSAQEPKKSVTNLRRRL